MAKKSTPSTPDNTPVQTPNRPTLDPAQTERRRVIALSLGLVPAGDLNVLCGIQEVTRKDWAHRSYGPEPLLLGTQWFYSKLELDGFVMERMRARRAGKGRG